MKLAKLVDKPDAAAWLHGASLLIWLIPGSAVTLLWLSDSVTWVSWMSLYAIVIGHWSALQAALAERRVKRDNEGDGE